MDAFPNRSKRHLFTAALIALVTLTLFLATLGDPGMAWDEGITIHRAERVNAWFGELIRPRELPSRLAAFRADVIVHPRDIADPTGRARSYWPFTRVWEGHPPLYAALASLGWALSHRWLEPLEAYRFGAALLFSVTASVVYLMLAGAYGWRAGVAACAALVFLPRLFAHAHFVPHDVPVACFWVLSAAAFLRAVGAGFRPACRSQSETTGAPSAEGTREHAAGSASHARRWTILFGFVLGLTLLTKFTGWLAVVPLLAWCLLYRNWSALKVLAVGFLLALVTFYVLNPPLWHHPIDGMRTFLAKNLHRAASQQYDIAGTFFGRNYTLKDPLPWYNSLVWAGITLPVGTLVLVIVGIGRLGLGKFQDRVGTLLLLFAGVLLVLRALPGAPPHDGIRLMLPSFAFLACLAGVGAAARRNTGQPESSPGTGTPVGAWPRIAAIGRRIGNLPGVSTAVVGLLLAGSALSTWLYHPYQLSHYNLLIGGLPGAVRAGMEPTYYWDALTDDVLAWINANTVPDEKVQFCTYAESLRYLREWSKLRPEVHPLAPGRFRWYVLQLRPSSYRAADRWLLGHAKPVFVKRLQDPPLVPWGPFRLNVPLIHIYDHEDYRQAVAVTEKSRDP